MANNSNTNNNQQNNRFFGQQPNSSSFFQNYQQRPPYIKREPNSHPQVNHFLDRDTVNLYSNKPFFLHDPAHGYFTPVSGSSAPPFAWLSVQGRTNGTQLAALWKHRDVLLDFLEQQNLEQNLPRHNNQQKGTVVNSNKPVTDDTQKNAVANILKELGVEVPEQKAGSDVNEKLKTGLIATLESLGFDIPEDKKKKVIAASSSKTKKSPPKTEVEKLRAELEALRNPSEESEVDRLKKELEEEKAKILRKEIAELKREKEKKKKGTSSSATESPSATDNAKDAEINRLRGLLHTSEHNFEQLKEILAERDFEERAREAEAERTSSTTAAAGTSPVHSDFVSQQKRAEEDRIKRQLQAIEEYTKRNTKPRKARSTSSSPSTAPAIPTPSPAAGTATALHTPPPPPPAPAKTPAAPPVLPETPSTPASTVTPQSTPRSSRTSSAARRIDTDFPDRTIDLTNCNDLIKDIEQCAPDTNTRMTESTLRSKLEDFDTHNMLNLYTHFNVPDITTRKDHIKCAKNLHKLVAHLKSKSLLE
jgi:hypothetical protein